MIIGMIRIDDRDSRDDHNDQGYHEQDHNHSFEYDFFARQTDIFAVDFFCIFLQCIFIEEELVNTMLDLCDGDGDGDDGAEREKQLFWFPIHQAAAGELGTARNIFPTYS